MEFIPDMTAQQGIVIKNSIIDIQINKENED
jgi:hypothetical protein